MEGFDIGADGDPYLDRLRIIQTPWFGIYLHKIHREDTDPDPHDHPWWFASIVLSGGYAEEVFPDKFLPDWKIRWRSRGSLRMTRRKASHRITHIYGSLWTLVFTGPRRSSWGFFRNNGGWTEFVPWKEYLEKFSVNEARGGKNA